MQDLHLLRAPLAMNGAPDRSALAAMAVAGADVAGGTRRGNRHGSVNQDSFIFQKVASSSGAVLHVLGVFDGHGMLGEVASLMARETLKKLCHKGPLLDGKSLADSFLAEPMPAMTALFSAMQAQVLSAHEKPPSKYTYQDGSYVWKLHVDDPEHPRDYVDENQVHVAIDFGCTATVVVVLPTGIVTGNVGDASAFLVTSRGRKPQVTLDGVEALSVLHRPDNPDEQARIRRDYPGAALFEDGYLCPVSSPVLADYQINITRSLGHKHFREIGVSPEPYVAMHYLPCGKDYVITLVLCSDGLTDEITPQRIGELAAAASSAKGLVEEMTSLAHSLGKAAGDADDVTAVVLRIVYPG
eukprot:m.41844 g.41844  ORF g.41844 m.41844 type:complete len:356 (-) comp5691_c0_seq2:2570-3637(-)